LLFIAQFHLKTKKQTNTEAGNLTICFCFHAENPVANQISAITSEVVFLNCGHLFDPFVLDKM
jgi:hypothetical protein